MDTKKQVGAEIKIVDNAHREGSSTMGQLQLQPREIELHLNKLPLRSGHAARVRALGGKVGRANIYDTCRIVHVNLGHPGAHPYGDPAAWALAEELLQSYPFRRQTCVIFRGCEDPMLGSAIVQYLRNGEPLAIAYGRYCAQTTERALLKAGEAR